MHWHHLCSVCFLRAHACLAGTDSYRNPATAAGPPVGAPGLQPHPLSHLLLVPVLPLLHANWGQRREQRHRPRVPVRGTQHVSLHVERPPAVPLGSRPAGSGQPWREEGEQRGHLPDRRRQWVGACFYPVEIRMRRCKALLMQSVHFHLHYVEQVVFMYALKLSIVIVTQLRLQNFLAVYAHTFMLR